MCSLLGQYISGFFWNLKCIYHIYPWIQVMWDFLYQVIGLTMTFYYGKVKTALLIVSRIRFPINWQTM